MPSAAELEIISLSLKVAMTAVLFSLPLGVGAAWLLARYRFLGRDLVSGLIHLPLVLPPVVTGYFLLSLFGRSGPIGAWLEPLGIVFAFDWTGAALAAGIMGFPLMVRSVRLAFDMAEARTSTDVVGDIQPVDEDLARIRISASWQRERGRFLRGLGAGLLSVLGALGLIAWLTRHRYLMPPTCIEMIGTAPAARPDA